MRPVSVKLEGKAAQLIRDASKRSGIRARFLAEAVCEFAVLGVGPTWVRLAAELVAEQRRALDAADGLEAVNGELQEVARDATDDSETSCQAHRTGAGAEAAA